MIPRIALLALCLLRTAPCQPPANLDFLAGQTDGQDLRQMLPRYLRNEAARLRLSPGTPSAQRRELLRARFLEGIGGLPQRTPLNPRVVGALERDGYRVEKIIFESQPGFYVTANLYLPVRGRPPYPAILFPLGHEPGAKAYPVWQRLLTTFARRGYVALAWDTLGQGERIQLYDDSLRGSKLRSSTTEHTVQGIQCLLTGDALARYTVWDGIRALDYLLSRPEVDPKRIGCTGNSGGGTHTAYLSALDDRIQVAAPSCYLTTWRRLLETIGPQDAEQCIPGFLGAGLDHPDLIHAFAPKPYLMLSAIRDFFSIAGARATQDEAREAYLALNASDRFSFAEADEGHGYSLDLRLASYRWFARWLKGAEEEPGEPELRPASEEELWCTRTGQVTTELGGETVFTLNRARARSFSRAATSPAEIGRLIGWPANISTPRVFAYGGASARGLTLEKLLFESEPGIRIPAVLVKASGAGANRPAVLLVPGRGKAAAWPEIEALTAAGAVVMAIDVRGVGETRPEGATKGSEWNDWFGDYDSAMAAVLLRRPLAGMRAADIRVAFQVLAARPGIDAQRIYGAASREGAVPLLHAAALGVPFSGLLLDSMLASYQSVAETPIHRRVFESVVPGALRVYDLPDLASLVAPRPVRIVDAADPLGNPLTLTEAKAAFTRAPRVTLLRRGPEDPPAQIYRSLLD